jgi:hypothetical protein
MALWKSVETFSSFGAAKVAAEDPLAVETGGGPSASQPPVRTCSACSGDYEDPDRTAWPPDEEEDDLRAEQAQGRALEKTENGDEFPAQEA